MRLAIATCADWPALHENDKPLIALFAKQAIAVEPAVWNDANIDWRSYDAVLIRSVWDYHLHIDAFIKWLDKLESLKVKVLNPVATIRQNLNKFYLHDLQQHGVEIIPTLFLEKTKSLDLSGVKSRGWQNCVIKPAVSAGAWHTRAFNLNELPEIEKEFKTIAAEYELLVQPFVEEVKTQGEISLLFFNRQYSHAVLKVPQPGDFRVQQQHGGITTPYEPPLPVIQTAEKILQLIQGELLYARVDGIVIDGKFQLMELELIEPFLFFDYKEGTMEKFVAEAAALFRSA
jgi:glutathione synthase/RimK-type ligase-like ATP-grasp enzyme